VPLFRLFVLLFFLPYSPFLRICLCSGLTQLFVATTARSNGLSPRRARLFWVVWHRVSACQLSRPPEEVKALRLRSHLFAT